MTRSASWSSRSTGISGGWSRLGAGGGSSSSPAAAAAGRVVSGVRCGGAAGGGCGVVVLSFGRRIRGAPRPRGFREASGTHRHRRARPPGGGLPLVRGSVNRARRDRARSKSSPCGGRPGQRLGDRRVAAAVDGAGAETRQRGQVLWGAVPLVAREAVAGPARPRPPAAARRGWSWRPRWRPAMERLLASPCTMPCCGMGTPGMRRASTSRACGATASPSHGPAHGEQPGLVDVEPCRSPPARRCPTAQATAPAFTSAASRSRGPLVQLLRVVQAARAQVPRAG